MKVAIATPVLAHYRRNLFRILDKEQSFRFVHYSAISSNSGIKSMNPDELSDFVEVKNLKLGPFLWQRGLLRMAAERQLDAIIFTGDAGYLSTWLSAGLARLCGKKVYFWTIGWHRPESGPKKFIRLSFYRIAHRLMVYGDPEKARAIAHGYPAHRIDVVYNSVTSLDEVDSWSDSTEKGLTVGALIRLNHVKRLDLLLEAVSILKRQGLNLKVLLGGTGPAREALEEQANKYGLDCEFLGAVYHPQQISDFYRRLMLTVVPSTAGLTTMQSMAHGVPVITDDSEITQAPEASAIVEDVTGSRFAADSADDLALRIFNWVERLRVDTARTAEDCRKEIRQRWSPEVQAQRIVDSLCRVDKIERHSVSRG